MRYPPDDYLPWPQLLEIALGTLGFAPETFWQMTAPEWLAALNGWKKTHGVAQETSAHITRQDLQYLMQRFPDERF